MAHVISDERFEEFWREGFVVVDDFLTPVELALVRDTARADEVLANAARDIRDSEGLFTDLTLWNHPGDDVYGVVARMDRMVGSVERLLGDEVYHYHSKLSAKRPRVGGAWEWHQDYGYWYRNGCLYPDMASVFLALDPCTSANGCLQVLRGSHHLGRIEHGVVADQTGADRERVLKIQERLQTVEVEMPAGAALFFHCNLLHRSNANRSDTPRFGLICCYNTRHNDPVIESHHPRYTPLSRLSDEALLAGDLRSPATNREFLGSREGRAVLGKAAAPDSKPASE